MWVARFDTICREQRNTFVSLFSFMSFGALLKKVSTFSALVSSGYRVTYNNNDIITLKKVFDSLNGIVSISSKFCSSEK